MPGAPKFTAGFSISCMTVPLWLARFWSTECPVNNALYFGHSNEMMGSVDFLGGCPASSHLVSSQIEHWITRKNLALEGLIRV